MKATQKLMKTPDVAKSLPVGYAIIFRSTCYTVRYIEYDTTQSQSSQNQAHPKHGTTEQYKQ